MHIYKMKAGAVSAALPLLLAGGGLASAQSPATGSLPVQIIIEEDCNVVATSIVNFGTNGVLTGANPIDAQGSVSVQCTPGTDYDIGLGDGAGVGGTTTTRKMTETGGATIDYQLFSNSGRTTNWGDDVGTDTVADTGTGATILYPVYGRVPIQNTPVTGTYTDTVEVTVTF